MVFSSLLFLLVFLPLFLIGYHLIDKSYKNGFALIASLVFYAWGAPDFIIIALFSIALDFYVIQLMDRQEALNRKLLLWVSIGLNVSLLLYFKYSNFFIENVNYILGANNSFNWTEIVLPIGISFFTFQKISYSVDIYRKEEKPLSSLFDYTLYILLFPQLIAGPIVRYKEISAQLREREHNNYEDKAYGIYRFSIGLAKKVLLANVLGEKADVIFALDYVDLDASIAWLGIICYTFQIYFDFSGYSDMAIGLGYLMGFKFPENFNAPYIAQSITEFWRRWHITLSNWMRDYLYIPLGGNRVNNKARLYINLSVVFIISGLWHGASWNFVLWGAFHGLFLILDRIFLSTATQKIGMVGRVLLTFFIVVLSWVLFRSNDLTQSVEYYKALFSFEFSNLHLFTSDQLNRTIAIAIILSFAMTIKKVRNGYNSFTKATSSKRVITLGVISIVLLVTSIANLTSTGFNPFIYFRF